MFHVSSDNRTLDPPTNKLTSTREPTENQNKSARLKFLPITGPPHGEHTHVQPNDTDSVSDGQLEGRVP